MHDRAYQLSKTKQKKIPVVVVLTGSQGVDNAVRALLLASYKLGYRVVAINPKDYYDVGKIEKIIKIIQERHPQSALLGIGI